MRFENSFELAAPPDQVFDVFRDPVQVAAFLPGATVQAPDEQGRYPAELAVSFGPKRLVFKGSLTNETSADSLSGQVSGSASANLKGAKMRVDMRYQLTAVGKGTRVELVSDAQLAGVLADFANSGGTLVAKTIIDTFVERLNAHFTDAAGTPPARTGAGPKAAPPLQHKNTSESLSGFSILVRTITATFRQWLRRLRFRRG